MKKSLIIIICGMLMFVTLSPAQNTLSLNDYREKVLAYNQDIKITQQTLTAAKAVVKEVHTGFLPSVSASGYYNYNFNPQTVNIGTLQDELQPSKWTAGGDISQPVYTGGLLSATYDAAKIQQEMAMLMEDESKNNIIYLSEITYWNVVASKDYANTLTKYLEILNNLYQVVKTRYNDGLISKTDLLKIETSLQEANYRESIAKQQLINNYILLNTLMGEAVDNQWALTDSLSELNKLTNLSTFEEVLGQRPDYLIKSKEIELQEQQKKIDRSEFLPKVSIGASADYGTPFINFSGDPLWTPAVYAKVSVPIFQWGKSKHSNDKNNALILTKQLAQSATADNIRKELSLAVNNMYESEKQINIALQTLNTAKESLDLHTFSYEEGQLPIIDVQFAQLSWLEASTKLVESYLKSQLALSKYKKEVNAK